MIGLSKKKIYFDPEGKTNTFGAYFMYYFCIIEKNG